MRRYDELNQPTAARRDTSGSGRTISSADTVTAAEATHNQSRNDLVRALEAMTADGWIKAVPAALTTEAAASATTRTWESR
ncbi:hypothetical protein [Nocardia fluminea]|uniref:Uncharacterized protein n=1 Tax=Nocardia fluminea TaxID=134984 RepID=A0A2N3V509_9NOCA|nr:hypothetical protein [Nocardia fluminea]PKV76704.1 hypothetical protein ATK86_7104 [Nocardia fluminea]